MEELTKILNKLYEDVALEKISEDRYQAMAPKYEREQAELRGKREALSAEIARNIARGAKWLNCKPLMYSAAEAV